MPSFYEKKYVSTYTVRIHTIFREDYNLNKRIYQRKSGFQIKRRPYMTFKIPESQRFYEM